jgi:hypothetical protein
MSYPRQVIAGSTVMITRRVLRRTKLLRPDAELDNLYLYCLAVTAERFGVDVLRQAEREPRRRPRRRGLVPSAL